MKELDRLKEMLDKANIPYETCDEDLDYFGHKRICRVHYPQNSPFVCSAIQGYGTYGNEENLIEIMGLLTEEEKELDNVVGHLTAEEVFQRIKNHWDTKDDK